jgi:hypothetical protein
MPVALNAAIFHHSKIGEGTPHEHDLYIVPRGVIASFTVEPRKDPEGLLAGSSSPLLGNHASGHNEGKEPL